MRPGDWARRSHREKSRRTVTCSTSPETRRNPRREGNTTAWAVHTAEPPFRVRSQAGAVWMTSRSEEHTSELQSRLHLVCRLLLEKKKKIAKDSKDIKETNDIERVLT